jgi:hypothetical protein
VVAKQVSPPVVEIWGSLQAVGTGVRPQVEVMWEIPQVVGKGEIPQVVEKGVTPQAGGISMTPQVGET